MHISFRLHRYLLVAGIGIAMSCSDGIWPEPEPATPATLEVSSSRDTITYGTLTASDTVYLSALVRDKQQHEFAGDRVLWSSGSFTVITPLSPDGRTAALTLSGPMNGTFNVVAWTHGMLGEFGTITGDLDLTGCSASAVSMMATEKILAGRSSDVQATVTP